MAGSIRIGSWFSPAVSFSETGEPKSLGDANGPERLNIRDARNRPPTPRDLSSKGHRLCGNCDCAPQSGMKENNMSIQAISIIPTGQAAELMKSRVQLPLVDPDYRFVERRPEELHAYARGLLRHLQNIRAGEKARGYATDREIHYLDENPVRIEINGVLNRWILGGSQSAKSEFKMFDAAHDERPAAPKKNDDDKILDTYLDHRNITGYARSEAETVWAKFKELTSK